MSLADNIITIITTCPAVYHQYCPNFFRLDITIYKAMVPWHIYIYTLIKWTLKGWKSYPQVECVNLDLRYDDVWPSFHACMSFAFNNIPCIADKIELGKVRRKERLGDNYIKSRFWACDAVFSKNKNMLAACAVCWCAAAAYNMNCKRWLIL